MAKTKTRRTTKPKVQAHRNHHRLIILLFVVLVVSVGVVGVRQYEKKPKVLAKTDVVAGAVR